MAILFANIPATLHRKIGFDLKGKPIWSAAAQIKVAIVTLRGKIEKTSVRADSSASRGRAEESRVDGTVLVPPGVVIKFEDRLTVMNVPYEVASVFPRIGLNGVLGHNQVDLRVLAGG